VELFELSLEVDVGLLKILDLVMLPLVGLDDFLEAAYLIHCLLLVTLTKS
jgi:hypothetical protein